MHAAARRRGQHDGHGKRLGSLAALSLYANQQVLVLLVMVVVAALGIVVQTPMRRGCAYAVFWLHGVLASMRTHPTACYQRQHAKEQHAHG